MLRYMRSADPARGFFVTTAFTSGAGPPAGWLESGGGEIHRYGAKQPVSSEPSVLAARLFRSARHVFPQHRVQHHILEAPPLPDPLAQHALASHPGPLEHPPGSRVPRHVMGIDPVEAPPPE